MRSIRFAEISSDLLRFTYEEEETSDSRLESSNRVIGLEV